MDEIDIEAKKKALGEKISRLRKKKGLTLEKLAYEAGISKGNLSDIENGKKDPRLITIIKIAGNLGLSVSMLLQNI